MRVLFAFFLLGFLFSACGTPRQLQQSAQNLVLNDSALQTAHVGISIYEPATGKWWYNHQGDKYFVPASNTKIVTAYAAMKYLGDSLVGLEYALNDSAVVFRGTGEPTLLHGDFRHQPVLDFLNAQKQSLAITEAPFDDDRWGAGWSVSDIDAAYAPERSELPVYGNVIRIYKQNNAIVSTPSSLRARIQVPAATDWRISFERPSLNENAFQFRASPQSFTAQVIPFVTGKYMSAWVLLMDTLQKNISFLPRASIPNLTWQKLYSRPTDSLLKPLLHRSDNFFAEQTLLMVSNKVLGYMNDARIIDTLLQTDLADLPHTPRWADGSGLSRYNLFTPQDFVFLLRKMKDEFGMPRIREVFPTGNEGTLTNFYKQDSTFLYAKTGTLSGVVALSGFLTTSKGKELIFSVLVNNHQTSAVRVRRAVEAFIQKLRQNH
ncbi:MAG: D-alanyl-D-alanine carboxypeptidase [Bacteroidota bacterium]|nr:D-alanyl-D-alanine carboxypeptidase [Bacteroidota bacterium]